jgi:uncharacterized membrane protein
MADKITSTRGGDAPLSSAKDPNPAASGLAVADEDAELVGRTVSIDRPRQELYAFWRDFRNLPLFMENIESVTELDSMRSHWKVKGPANTEFEWDSLITEDQPGEVIAWSSAKSDGLQNSGRVEFRDSGNGRGTFVTVTIVYEPPGGALGKAFAKIFRREPKIQARQELRRFKQLMETGEIPTSAMTPEAAVGEA